MPISRFRHHLAALLALCAIALVLPRAAAASTGASTYQGTLALVGQSDFVVHHAGRPRGVISTLVTAADRLALGTYAYVWGGGHAQAGVPSVGMKGPGHNGRRRGFDCSGSVAAVLSEARLWPTGAAVPGDSGVISELRAWHLIAPGAGRGPTQVNLYDYPGVHIFMSIGGRFFGTSAGGYPGNSKGGPGWLDGSTPDAFSRHFKRYHFLPSVLHGQVAGQDVAFRSGTLAGLVGQFQPGEPISVSYRQTQYGTLVATSVAYPGATSVTGTVTAVAPDGSSLTVQTPSGSPATVETGGLAGLVLGSVTSGEPVTISYSNVAGTLTLRTIAPAA
jgi:hypothetical protein